MEILSQHTVDIQQHCAVFDKAPVAFAMFRLIFGTVSYTHLTLPTKRIVEISVVAGSLKQKKEKKKKKKQSQRR